jgi:invasion protein IalB
LEYPPNPDLEIDSVTESQTMRATFAATLMIGLLASVPAAAADPAASPAAGAAKKPARDMNEVVCEREQVIGSRLGSKRVCMTRAEWADLRHQDRQELDRVQVKRTMDGNGN